jgi:diacylglycerol kinase (ATP)
MIAALTPRIEAAFPGVEWCPSQSATHLTELCRTAADAGFARVIVAGGDGALHYAVRGLVHSQTALGVLPAGTGNDFALALGLAPGSDRALRALTSGVVTAIDAGQAGDIPFCCVAGVGLDAVALEAINNSPMPRSNFKYRLYGIGTLLRYKAVRAELRIDEQAIATPLLFAAFANTRTYAGGNPIVPDAKIADGLLDYCIFADTPRVTRLATFARLTSGRHVGAPGVSIGTARHAMVSSDVPLPVTLDGELTDLRTPIEFKVLPGALKVILPAKEQGTCTHRCQSTAMPSGARTR